MKPFSADGIPVVIHDARLERTTNGTGYVGSHTLSELQALDAGVRCRIPSLEEFFAWAAQSSTLMLNVEIKHMTYECVDKTVDMLRSLGLFDCTVLACFDAAIIRYAHKRHHTLDRCRTQFKLVRDMEEQFDDMATAVTRYEE